MNPHSCLLKNAHCQMNMKISQDILKKFGCMPGCAKCRKLSRNEYFHPGLAHSQDCRTRIEAVSRTDLVYRDRAERAEQRSMDFCAKEVERIDHPRRVSLEPMLCLNRQLERLDESEDQPSVRGTPNEPVGNQNRTCPVKSLFHVQMKR